MNSTFKKRYTLFVALLAVGIIPAIGATQVAGQQENNAQLAQMAELEGLHATFHAAVSVRDPVNGDSSAVITARIRQALSIWTNDAKLVTAGGNYIGNGDPDDPTTCPEPSADTSATGTQGTLCTFFKYVAGGLQQTNKWVSLSPAYNTKFVPVKQANGRWKSSVYFECHYFDVSLNPASNEPFWTAVSHVGLTGEARKINGQWRLTYASAATVGIPLP